MNFQPSKFIMELISKAFLAFLRQKQFNIWIDTYNLTLTLILSKAKELTYDKINIFIPILSLAVELSGRVLFF